MQRLMTVAAIGLLTVAGVASADGPTLIDGNVERGQDLSAACVECHGADGNSPVGQFPSLAGQHAGYLFKQLKDYQSGERPDPVMAEQVKELNEQDMRDLAAFYATQEAEERAADEDLVELGEAIYRGGIRERAVPACIACHGPRGRGNPATGYPAVAGQHAQYSVETMRRFKAGDRANDPEAMMRTIAERLTEEEIRAVSSYMQGLH